MAVHMRHMDACACVTERESGVLYFLCEWSVGGYTSVKYYVVVCNDCYRLCSPPSQYVFFCLK